MDRKYGFNIGNPGKYTMRGRKHSKESRLKMSKIKKVSTAGKLNGFYGKKHSKETKEKISKKLKGIFSGNKNPMYGKPSNMKNKKMSNESKILMSINHADFKGEKHPRAKLKEVDVINIINLLLDGIKIKDISKIYNVSQICIQGIKQHKNWKYLTCGILFPKYNNRPAETTISQS